MKVKRLPAPRSLHLQWHITEKCNLRCKHCYTESKYLENELSEEELYRVLDQYKELLNKWNISKKDTHLTLTGGEPLLRKEFFPLIERFYENKSLFRYNVMSNGMLIDRKIARKLKELEVENVQLSIEGMEKNNDEIRGQGTFKRIVNAAKVLKDENLHISFSLTVFRQNFKDIEKLIELCLSLGVNVLGVGRLVPWGRGEEMRKKILTPPQVKELYEYVFKKNKELSRVKKDFFISTGCSNSLWCASDPGFKPHGCSAGYDCLTPMPNGDVLPCRRLPIKVGNVKEKTLFEIWYESNILWKLRNLKNFSETCRNCNFWRDCKGGARCVAYGYFKNEFAPDPQCWVRYNELPEKNYNSKISNEVLLNKKHLKNSAEENPAKEISFIDRNSENFMELKPEDLDKVKLDPKKKWLISFNISENELKEETGSKIMHFLDKLEKEGVEFRITKPVPMCVAGIKNRKALGRFKIPKSCEECLELFSVNDKGEIEFCKVIGDRNGPNLIYMKNRPQIYEYFRFFYNEKNPREKCKKCIYFLRKDCEGLNFRS